uniref:Uncharacterized protein LOC114324150 n=1 Tax=Diabrotica virgifera virgifera TaxID=50390 RepID=A0A6P7F2E5_DIAVI
MAVVCDDPLFNINFVRVIESRPCIWNYNLQEYSKRNITEKAWTEIANEVNDTVTNCRERWRNIRTAFLRSLKAPPSGSGKNSKKKYYLSQCLEFLLPYTKSKHHTGNLEALVDYNQHLDDETDQIAEFSEDHETDTPDTVRKSPNRSTSSRYMIEEFMGPNIDETIITPRHPNNKSKIYHSLHPSTPSRYMTDEFTGPTVDETIITSRHPNKKSRICQQTTTNSSISTPADDAFIGWLQQKKGKENVEVYYNLSFLRSLLPDMKKMTEKQNRRFRQKVVALMDDILEDTDMY